MEDLFEKFPNGFIISQTRLFEENGKKYRLYIEVEGEKESEVEYKKGANLVLAKSKLTEELLPKNYFLFQKLKLNKDIFKQLEVEKNLYTHANGRYTILYSLTNDEINNYFNLNDEQITLGVSGEYNEEDKTYFHNITIRKKTKTFTFYERIVEEK